MLTLAGLLKIRCRDGHKIIIYYYRLHYISKHARFVNLASDNFICSLSDCSLGG